MDILTNPISRFLQWNVYLEKGLVTCNNVNSLIKVLLQYTALDAFLPCHFILSCELNKAFDDIASKTIYISKFFHIKPW